MAPGELSQFERRKPRRRILTQHLHPLGALSQRGEKATPDFQVLTQAAQARLKHLGAIETSAELRTGPFKQHGVLDLTGKGRFGAISFVLQSLPVRALSRAADVKKRKHSAGNPAQTQSSEQPNGPRSLVPGRIDDDLQRMHE